jgi:hypothetical protein
MNARTAIGIGACVLVLGGLGLGFSEIGSPAHNRARAEDARLQQAIYDIAHATSASASDRVVYPPDLDADLRGSIVFENRSKIQYALCADFTLAGNEFSRYGVEAPTWAHPQGRHCYRFSRRQLREDRYTPVPSH